MKKFYYYVHSYEFFKYLYYILFYCYIHLLLILACYFDKLMFDYAGLLYSL